MSEAKWLDGFKIDIRSTGNYIIVDHWERRSPEPITKKNRRLSPKAQEIWDREWAPVIREQNAKPPTVPPVKRFSLMLSFGGYRRGAGAWTKHVASFATREEAERAMAEAR